MVCKNKGIHGFLGPSWVLLLWLPLRVLIVSEERVNDSSCKSRISAHGATAPRASTSQIAVRAATMDRLCLRVWKLVVLWCCGVAFGSYLRRGLGRT